MNNQNLSPRAKAVSRLLLIYHRSMQCEIETGDPGVDKNAGKGTTGQWPPSPTMGVIFLLLVSSLAYANALVI